MGILTGREEIGKRLGLELPPSCSEARTEAGKWLAVYQNQPPWERAMREALGDFRPLRLVPMLTAHLAKLCNNELEVKLEGSRRAAFLQEALQNHFLVRISEYCQLALALGYVVVRPMASKGHLCFDVLTPLNFLPVSFDPAGRCTEGVCLEYQRKGRDQYVRAERHSMDGGRYTVANRAFLCNGDSLGNEIPLSQLPEWADYQPETVLEGVDRPLLVTWRIPVTNNLDPFCPLPPSLFANSMSTLRDIDELHTKYCNEFLENRLIVDESCIRERGPQAKGKTITSRLFLSLNTMGGDDGRKMFEAFSPPIREEALANGISKEIRLLESQMNISPGTFAFNPGTGTLAATATEILQKDRTTYNMAVQLQEKERGMLEDLVYAADRMASLYRLAPEGGYHLGIAFGDSVFEDTSAKMARDLTLVREGIMPRWEFRMKWLQEDEETARKMAGGEAEALGFQEG